MKLQFELAVTKIPLNVAQDEFKYGNHDNL